MSIEQRDRATLRELAKRVADVAAMPGREDKREMWRRLNRLESERPMVWINEIPWEEIIQQADLGSADPVCRRHEMGLRRTLWQWENCACDMVVDPVYYAPRAIRSSGYGLEVHSVGAQDTSGARDYIPVMRTEADVDLIQTPRVWEDREESERTLEILSDIFGDILRVESRGACRFWLAPWDKLIQWWGIEELYRDMMDRPAFVHKGAARMSEAMLGELRQHEDKGLLSVSDGNHRVGSGGLGITDELPQPDYDGEHARLMDLWGSSTGQIFSEVSPAMHEEFCLRYEIPLLELFGLNCYGCCEPLHRKMEIVRAIPRLRRVSMSTWIDVDMAVEAVGADYIFSYKPNPAVLAGETWDREPARRELRDVLEKTRGCVVELIMKDITTLRNDPRRLAAWADMAMELVEEYA